MEQKNLHADLALSKQAFDELVRLCEPEEIKSWIPNKSQRERYVELCNQFLRGVREFTRFERRRLLADGSVQNTLPSSLLAFLTGEAKTYAPSVRAALDHLDPEGVLLREITDSTRHSGSNPIRNTFLVGIDQVVDLIDRNQWEPGHGLYPETAYDVFDSALVSFEPDDWLHRLNDLSPIRTDRPNLSLPVHVRLRLQELYRAYIFGLWLSVISLSRSTLEYSLLDNLHKFKIKPNWPDRDGRPREKKLSHLIDEVADHLPDWQGAMNQVRDLGNDYLHPRRTKVSKEMLLGRQQDAYQVMSKTREVVEALYQARPLD